MYNYLLITLVLVSCFSKTPEYNQLSLKILDKKVLIYTTNSLILTENFIEPIGEKDNEFFRKIYQSDSGELVKIQGYIVANDSFKAGPSSPQEYYERLSDKYFQLNVNPKKYFYPKLELIKYKNGRDVLTYYQKNYLNEYLIILQPTKYSYLSIYLENFKSEKAVKDILNTIKVQSK